MIHEWSAWYALITTIITFVALIQTPTKLSPFTNFVVALSIAVFLGWIFWMVAIIIYMQGRINRE